MEYKYYKSVHILQSWSGELYPYVVTKAEIEIYHQEIFKSLRISQETSKNILPYPQSPTAAPFHFQYNKLQENLGKEPGSSSLGGHMLHMYKILGLIPGTSPPKYVFDSVGHFLR